MMFYINSAEGRFLRGATRKETLDWDAKVEETRDSGRLGTPIFRASCKDLISSCRQREGQVRRLRSMEAEADESMAILQHVEYVLPWLKDEESTTGWHNR